MSSRLANNFKMLLATKKLDLSADVFKVILMEEGFTFAPATHDLLADVSASELATGSGYTAGGATLSNVALTQNDTDGTCDVTWDNPTWTASGGDIGPVCGAIIYDDTYTGKPVVGFIDFGGSYTEPDGGVAVLGNVKVRI